MNFVLKQDFKVQHYIKQVQLILNQTKTFWTWLKNQKSVVKKSVLDSA